MQKGYSFYGELLSRKRKDVDTLRRERVEKTWRAKTNLPLDSGQKNHWARFRADKEAFGLKLVVKG